MDISARLDRLRQIGPVFRSRDALAVDVSWRDLYALRDHGMILELSRGVYQLAETELGHVDFVAVGSRAPHGMICLGSALAYWDLSDEIPSRVHLAVPGRTHRPTIDFPPTQVHVFDAATFVLGRIEVTESSGGHFWISDRERTVVDAFRLRHRIGDDLAFGALRRYLEARPDPARLSTLARRLRVSGPVLSALQVMQA